MLDAQEVEQFNIHLPKGEFDTLSMEAAAFDASHGESVNWPKSQQPFDLLLDFYETEKCPFVCKNCVQSSSDEVRFDMLEVVGSLHSALQSVNRKMILWCNGGEPATVADRLLRYQETGVCMGMPTTGLFKQAELLKFVLYPNTVRVNISVLGSPATEGRLRGREAKGKLDYKRDWLFDIPEDHRWKVSLLYIIYSETLETGEYMSDISWILENYPGFKFFVSYDRGDARLNETKLLESYNLLHILRRSLGVNGGRLQYKIGSTRFLPPTTFANGEHFRLNYRNQETFIPWQEVRDHPLAFFNEVIRHHNMGTRDASVNCDVWKQYECGGPGCRFGHVPSCESYWRQMIPFQHQVQEVPIV